MSLQDHLALLPPDMKNGTKSWLSNDFVRKVFNTNASVEECRVESVVSSWECNQCSFLYRIWFGNKSFVVKAVRGGKMMALVKELKMIEKEVAIYRQMLPRVKEMVGEEVSAGFTDVGLDEVLILDDLKTLGYQVKDRRDMLGWNDSVVAINAMARYHAATHILLQAEPNSFACLRSVAITKSPLYKKVFEEVVSSLGDAVLSWPDEAQYSDRIKAHAVKSFDMVEAELSRPPLLKVLSHGDFHTNNIMFHKDLATARFIDFAFTMETSPAIDIIYYLQTSAKDEVHSRKEELFSIYADSFNGVLDGHGNASHKRISGEMVGAEVARFPAYSFLESATRGAVVLGEEGVDLSTLIANKTLHLLFNSKHSVNRLSQAIKKAVVDGIL